MSTVLAGRSVLGVARSLDGELLNQAGSMGLSVVVREGGTLMHLVRGRLGGRTVPGGADSYGDGDLDDDGHVDAAADTHV